MYLKRNASEDTVETEVQRFKEERQRNVKQEESEVQEVISRVRALRPLGESPVDGEVVNDEDDDVRRGDDDADDSGNDMMSSASPARGRGSRRPSRGRGESSRRGGRGRGGRGRASSSSTAEDPPASTSRRGSHNTRSIKDAFLMGSKRSRAKTHAV